MAGKRREPSGGHQSRGQSTKFKEDVVSIRENTLRLLRAGARANGCPSTGPNKSSAEAVSRHTIGGSQGHDSLQSVFVTDPSHGVVAISNPTHLCNEGVNFPNGTVEGRDEDMEDACCQGCGKSAHAACAHCSSNLDCGEVRICNDCQEPFCAQCSVPNYDERYDRTFCLECHSQSSRRDSSGPARGQQHSRENG